MFSLFMMMFTLSFICVGGHGKAAANTTLYVTKVIAAKANVYMAPDVKSAVLTVLNKGDEYPRIASAAGDSASQAVHSVVSGDTLAIIASHYGLTVEELQQANTLHNTDLQIGQTLRIPQKTVVHTVTDGDHLKKIAAAYDVTVTELIQINRLNSTQIQVGQKLKIPDYYIQIQLLEGKKGWIKKSLVQSRKVNRIIMGWNFGGTVNQNLTQSKNPNLNVVSPRWFELNDKSSVITIKENSEFVRTAHNLGKRVWPLLGNRFNAELTDIMLSDPGKRRKAVFQIRESLIRTDADGVNVDFQNLNPKNKQDFVVFIQELTNSLKPHGLLVSVDVTRASEDPYWSGSYDRAGLGQAADFIVMMGYEEHWSGGGKTGSVASLSWVKGGIVELMKEVPSHKIILAIPFFAREWVTDIDTQKITSHDCTMAEVAAVIKARRLSKTWHSAASQNYVQFTVNGKLHQIWVEDKDSVKARYALVQQYRLRGISAWYLGSETQDVWSVFKS
ncbi:LysM peptidoglycan-binding domain-containing protein [Paenibacillus abyssi]|nr:LysM peptidoglycan-binding domain-containing protein [Paenibacillus abyssi]